MVTKQDLINLLKEKEKEREELRRILQSYLYKDMDIDTFLIHWKDYAFIRATIQSYKQALEVIENERKELLKELSDRCGNTTRGLDNKNLQIFYRIIEQLESQQKQNGESPSMEGNEKSVNLSAQSKDDKTADVKLTLQNYEEQYMNDDAEERSSLKVKEVFGKIQSSFYEGYKCGKGNKDKEILEKIKERKYKWIADRNEIKDVGIGLTVYGINCRIDELDEIEQQINSENKE